MTTDCCDRRNDVNLNKVQCLTFSNNLITCSNKNTYFSRNIEQTSFLVGKHFVREAKAIV